MNSVHLTAALIPIYYLRMYRGRIWWGWFLPGDRTSGTRASFSLYRCLKEKCLEKYLGMYRSVEKSSSRLIFKEKKNGHTFYIIKSIGKN